jgi:Rdx family
MAPPETAQDGFEKYGEVEVPLPRIAIKFCVQCKWNLRAAYVCQVLILIVILIVIVIVIVIPYLTIAVFCPI